MKEITFAIKILGCKVNQYESQIIRENLTRFGYRETEETKADVVIINSCTVTGEADRKTRKLIKSIKKNNPGTRVIVTGCYAVSDDDIARLYSMREIFRVVPNSIKTDIPLILNSLYGVGPAAHGGIYDNISGFDSHTRAFVKIQDGCDQSCSYCKVTLVRGPSRSRERSEILEEVERLINAGYREVVMTGICLGAWKGKCNEDLAGLLKGIEDIRGDFRIRLSSLEPNYISSELLEVISGSKRICKHLHIPLQSGSDRVLALMKRRYNTRQFRDLVRRVRSLMPMAGITMDVIAGFPGEEEKDIDLTVSFLKEIAPSRLHIFKYSDRAGTLASEMGKKVSPGTAKERVERLISLGRELQSEFAKKFIARDVDVLVEGGPEGHFVSGYTSEYIRVKISGFAGKENCVIRVRPEKFDKKNSCLIALLDKER